MADPELPVLLLLTKHIQDSCSQGPTLGAASGELSTVRQSPLPGGDTESLCSDVKYCKNACSPWKGDLKDTEGLSGSLLTKRDAKQ